MCDRVKGCACKRGCKTQACGCRKKGKKCGPSCTCHNCINTHVPHTSSDLPQITDDSQIDCNDIHDDEYMYDEHTSISTDSSDNELDQEIITDDTSTFIDLFDIEII